MFYALLIIIYIFYDFVQQFAPDGHSCFKCTHYLRMYNSGPFASISLTKNESNVLAKRNSAVHVYIHTSDECNSYQAKLKFILFTFFFFGSVLLSNMQQIVIRIMMGLNSTTNNMAKR